MTVLQGKVRWHEFVSAVALADAFSATVAGKLAEAVAARGSATIAVSGGSTPGLFFRTLASKTLPWSQVTVMLVDERFVPASSPRSNAGLVAANLLQGEAKAAKFVGLFHPAETIEAAAERAEQELRRLPWPLDVVVLGMGTDGHTASFFPDARNLPALLDKGQERLVLPVEAESAGEPRLTLSLPAIAGARFTAVHIEGDAKRGVLQQAISGNRAYPIATVLEKAREPAEIFWAP